MKEKKTKKTETKTSKSKAPKATKKTPKKAPKSVKKAPKSVKKAEKTEESKPVENKVVNTQKKIQSRISTKTPKRITRS